MRKRVFKFFLFIKYYINYLPSFNLLVTSTHIYGKYEKSLEKFMKSAKDIQNVLTNIIHWAKTQNDIKGIALVGSYARDMATHDSDIDLVIIAKNHKNYLIEQSWLHHFGQVQKVEQINYGKLTSLHVHYLNSYEIEFGITTSAWTKIPADRGTADVILNGIKILYDPKHLIKKIVNHVQQEFPPDKLQHILKTQP